MGDYFAGVGRTNRGRGGIMTVLKLVAVTNPGLRRPTRGVARLLPHHRDVGVTFPETTQATEGLGLSANR
ncbi:hypothetical protein LCGC14_0363830 [marine sediment metagenome]|uniref:Uncharacterized protein n=1 Tax=marine sediment metagenome TaxID=412755 RepID=A0A0F9TCU6_9ZZZZ